MASAEENLASDQFRSAELPLAVPRKGAPGSVPVGVRLTAVIWRPGRGRQEVKVALCPDLF